MKKLIAIAVAGAGIFAGSLAIAAEDPISVRKSLMKDVGAAMGTLAKMAKGEMDFNAGSAGLAIRTMHAASYGFGHYFPKGSESGMETTAAPAIWEKMGDFEAALGAFQKSTNDALANAPKSKDDLGPIMGSLGKSCGSCHKVFRVKKDG